MYTRSLANSRRFTKRKVRNAPAFCQCRISKIGLLSEVVCIIGIATSCAATAFGNPLQDWIAEEAPQLTQLYKELHQSPELSFQEEKTAERMAAEIRELGFEVTTAVGGHGVVGVLKNGEGKTLLLRADMDALPVVEETGLDYASQVKIRDERGATVGVMHACGHDMHMTNLVGALGYLSTHREAWQGTLVAIFQPAEERGAGAKAMIADGMLRRFPRPDFALAMHVAADTAAGTIGYRAGYAQANVDSVDIEIHGRGGHGAYPHATVDPVVIAARLVIDLQTIVSREIDPIEPAVITVGSIHGGTKHNIIGDTCHLQLTVRSYSPAVRKQLIAAIRRKALAAAASADAPEPEISATEGTPSLFNDPELTERIVPTIKQVFGEAKVTEMKPSMGGEDFGRIGREGVPILMLKLGAVNQSRLDEYKQQGTMPPSLHSPKFYPDPAETITTGVTTFVTAVLELLKPESR
ncbi:MAG: amidohydrolase [Planctomycetes bacterium]|nr:amidohydrolase [Planctomycetota bacterium]